MKDYKEFIESEEFHKKGHINLMVFPSCSIKVATTEALKTYVDDYNKKHDVKIYFPMADTMDFKDYMEAMEYVDDVEQYPDIILQCDYKSLFAPNFIKFREAGHFVDVLKDRECNPFYKSMVYQDPKGTYTLLGANFSIFAVDKTTLGDLPIPKGFKDLLDPMYQDKIAIHGHGTSSCDMTVIMHIASLYGREGMQTFAKSIHSLRHFSQVVAEIGKGKKEFPPISIIPETFANVVLNKPGTQVVWPEDGSPLFPLWMTVKNTIVNEAKELIDFLTGSVMGQVWASSSFYSVNPDVNNRVKDEMPVGFLGWDMIYNDIYNYKTSMEEEALEIIRGYVAERSEMPKLIC